MSDLDEDEMRVMAAITFLQEDSATYFEEAHAESLEKAAPSPKASAEDEPPAEPKGFMREWCSFASLYKDSYCSGPNRFEVMTALARERELDITGMAVAGKPGGLVVEGEEHDLVAFMKLMRAPAATPACAWWVGSTRRARPVAVRAAAA